MARINRIINAIIESSKRLYEETTIEMQESEEKREKEKEKLTFEPKNQRRDRA